MAAACWCPFPDLCQPPVHNFDLIEAPIEGSAVAAYTSREGPHVLQITYNMVCLLKGVSGYIYVYGTNGNIPGFLLKLPPAFGQHAAELSPSFAQGRTPTKKIATTAWTSSSRRSV